MNGLSPVQSTSPGRTVSFIGCLLGEGCSTPLAAQVLEIGTGLPAQNIACLRRSENGRTWQVLEHTRHADLRQSADAFAVPLQRRFASAGIGRAEEERSVAQAL